MTCLLLTLLLPGAAQADGIAYLDEKGQTQTCSDYTLIDDAYFNNNGTSFASGWYAVSGEVTVSGRIQCTGEVHLILLDGCELKAEEGIEVSADGASLTIYAGRPAADTEASAGTGKLTAEGGSGAAGIGGGSGEDGHDITVNGGTVTANGTAKFTVQPKEGLSSGDRSETILLRGSRDMELEITAGPSDVTVMEGEKATFSVTATGTGKLKYQWQIDRGSGWKDLKGATKATYTTSAAKLSNDGYRYRVTVTDEIGSIVSDPATLTVLKKEIPVTGGFTHPGLWLALALVAAAGLAYRKRYTF